MSLGFMIIAFSPVGTQMRTNWPLLLVGVTVVLIGVYEYIMDKRAYNQRKAEKENKS